MNHIGFYPLGITEEDWRHINGESKTEDTSKDDQCDEIESED